MTTYCTKKLDESDVYVYRDYYGMYRCHECLLSGGLTGPWVSDTPVQMIAHLGKHRATGHKVPANVFQELTEERGR